MTTDAETVLTDARLAADSQAGAGDSAFLSGLKSRARSWGLRRALYWQLMHGLRRIGFNIHYVRIGADRPDLVDPERPQVPPGYVVKKASREDFLPFVGRVPHLDADFVETAFARGDEATLILFDGQPANFCFASRCRARVTAQLDVTVPKGFRYGYKDWTHPAHRRRNLSRLGQWFRNVKVGRPFNERSISMIATHNYPSLLRSFRHPSERPIQVGYVGWISLFGRQIPFNSRKAKEFGFEIVRKDDRRVRQYIR